MTVNNLQQTIEIMPITGQFEKAARQLILDGLEERFGFLDRSFNHDLENIIENYCQDGGVFLIGLHGNTVVCTGALTKEDATAGRIQRMSVEKSHRQTGVAQLMIQALEEKAHQKGYRKLVLETNNEWHSALEFYKKMGYQVDRKDKERSHFLKGLE